MEKIKEIKKIDENKSLEQFEKSIVEQLNEIGNKTQNIGIGCIQISGQILSLMKSIKTYRKILGEVIKTNNELVDEAIRTVKIDTIARLKEIITFRKSTIGEGDYIHIANLEEWLKELEEVQKK